MAKIQWLASYPKSGNTWVRALLDAYVKGKVHINDMSETVGDSNFVWYQNVCPVPYDQLDSYQFMMVRQAALFLGLTLNAHKNPLVMKTHNSNAQLMDQPVIPFGISGPSVYLIRDPRDVAPSFASHQGVDLDTIISNMANPGFCLSSKIENNSVMSMVARWDAHVQSWEKYPSLLVVRYEDLKDDPEKWLTKIVKHFRYDYSSKKVKNAIKQCELDRLRKQEDQAPFREASKHTKFFGRKNPKLLVRQRKLIEKEFKETMEKHGYL